jgi:hypothetical protein
METIQLTFDLTIAQLIPLLLFQVLTLLGYGVFLSVRGIDLPQPSLSETYYQLKPYGQEWVFILFMFLVGLPLLFFQSPWFFMAGGMFTAVGVAAKFKDTWGSTDEVHYVAATAGIFLSMIGLLSWGVVWPFLLWGIGSLSLYILERENTIWWVEMIAIGCIIGGIIDKMYRMLG